ncbi:hypothetical protein [Pseudonocardia sp. N23]|uniref:hypothetical protein n=1 Tax=Pseudonocardia sp. N23 TaxID=1987376 RepID=UPI000C034FD5|nr:hypothetical protein [Pseudonocardia sp. N23]GAY08606.1 hypothetical protein TOK_2363 [Pseudonocardia sp. N23]
MSSTVEQYPGPGERQTAEPDQSDQQMLARCQRRLRRVLPELPDTLEELRLQMQTVRGRDIEVQISDPSIAGLPAGLWSPRPAVAGRAAYDLIWVDRRTSPFARTVVACHEFGHMICEHQLHGAPANPQPLTELAHGLRLTPATITTLIGRCGEPFQPGSPEWRCEREAELTGRILAQHILDPDRDRRRGILGARRGRRSHHRALSNLVGRSGLRVG